MDRDTHTHTTGVLLLFDDDIGVVADVFCLFLESDAALLRSRTGHYKVVYIAARQTV